MYWYQTFRRSSCSFGYTNAIVMRLMTTVKNTRIKMKLRGKYLSSRRSLPKQEKWKIGNRNLYRFTAWSNSDSKFLVRKWLSHALQRQQAETQSAVLTKVNWDDDKDCSPPKVMTMMYIKITKRVKVDPQGKKQNTNMSQELINRKLKRQK